MKLCLLVNSGFEELAKQEVEELVNKKIQVSTQVLEVEATPEEALKLATHLQSVRRILIAFDSVTEINKAKFDPKLLSQLFFDENTFKVEVEQVKGNSTRIEIAQKIAGEVFSCFDKVKLDLRKPESYVVVFFNGERYFIGLDLVGKEINSREYRIFLSPASFKGDLAYYFVRSSGLKIGEQLLIGFAKDGTLAIEAVLFMNQLPVLKQNEFWKKIPILAKTAYYTNPVKEKMMVQATDTNMQNITATRKNSILAGCKDYLGAQKYSLDEWDIKFSKEQFDRIILQVTTKDEDEINEIYYQTSYVLKHGGFLMLIGRPTWDLTISEKFELIECKEIFKGESGYKFWLLKRL
ncbi:hypothetical protein COY27_06240 [Candidatus Woesearchaeota archaeon CG_4_10_14_0_2_um_filter_33_13]|nr:MAG: hypothetical protein COY27_06240 [Candidatus Woesearchaeota archaeon CG_4_10_14_0_2_um_filter_33_13]